MEQKSADRRIRKTKKALKDGLTDLMVKKSFQDISVKELTDKVDLNRGTFYLHYKDVFDMVNQIENEMFEEFRSVLSTHDPIEMNGQPLPLLEDIFEFLKENAVMCTALLSDHGDIVFIENFKQLIREKSFYDWKILFNPKNPKKLEYYYSYMLSGCIGLFTTWLQNGLQETPKEMAVMTEAMFLHGIDVLK